MLHSAESLQHKKKSTVQSCTRAIVKLRKHLIMVCLFAGVGWLGWPGSSRPHTGPGGCEEALQGLCVSCRLPQGDPCCDLPLSSYGGAFAHTVLTAAACCPAAYMPCACVRACCYLWHTSLLQVPVSLSFSVARVCKLAQLAVAPP